MPVQPSKSRSSTQCVGSSTARSCRRPRRSSIPTPIPTPLVERMKELGLFGATIPFEYGGLGLDVTTYAMVVEELSRGWMSLSGVLNTHMMLAFVLKTFGTDRAEGALSSGHGARRAPCARSASPSRMPGATCSGSARRPCAGAIDYVVNGSKMFITNAETATLFNTAVKTDPDADPPYRGISLLIVEKGPGVAVTRKLDKLGYKGIETCEVVFEDCAVPAAEPDRRQRGRGIQASTGRPRGRARQHRRPRSRRVPGRARGGAPLQPATANVRQADLRASSRAAEARRHGYEDRGGRASRPIPRRRRKTAASAVISKPAWRSYSPPRRAKKSRSKPCASSAATATSPSFPSSATIETRRLMLIGEGTNEIQRTIIARQLIERNRL